MSYGFWLAACLTGVITAAVTLLGFDQLQGTMLTLVEREFPNETPATREDVVTAALGIIIGGGAVLVLVQTMVAMSMNAGRRAARPILVVLAAITAGYAVAVYRSSQIETRVGLVVTVSLMVIALVLMFLVRKGDWFTGKQVAQYDVYD